MKQRSHSLSRASQALRHAAIQRDNIALVPASLLPFEEEWRRIADGLPLGGVLVIVPAGDTPLHRILRTLAPHLHACGCHVTAIRVDQLRGMLDHKRSV